MCDATAVIGLVCNNQRKKAEKLLLKVGYIKLHVLRTIQISNSADCPHF